MRLTRFGILIFALLLAASPAAAIISEATDVSSYSVTAEPGYVVYQIIVDPVPMGTNQTHTLNYNGANFLLSIGTHQSYAIFHDFDISLTFPNGTTQAIHRTYTGYSSGFYKLDIQPIFYQAQSLNPTFAVYVGVGLSPVSAYFNAMSSDWDPFGSGYDATGAIPFSAASGELGTNTNVFVHQMTEQEFTENVVHYNPAFGIKNLASTVFQWTWGAVIGFVSMVPVIGPAFVTFLELIGIVIPELIFWLGWIIGNFPAILLSMETVIIMLAIGNSGKKTDLTKAMKNFYNYHVAMIKGFLGLIEVIRSWTVSLIELITSIVQALKPL